MIRRRVPRAAMAVLLAITSVGLRPGPAAAAGACASTGDHWQSGHLLYSPGGVVHGAIATVEYVNEALCVGATSMSLSSSWVSIQGLDPLDTDSLDIYQVGFVKSSTSGFPSSSVTYLFWAYGRRGTTACGNTDIHPTPHILVSAGIVNVPFKIDRGTNATGQSVYYASVNGVRYNEQLVGSIDTCWVGGPKRGGYANEILNTADQSGGTPTNVQSWTSVKYKNGSNVWVNMSGTPVTKPCALHDLAWQKCVVGPAADGFETWDLHA
jgi:hypothetical protein